MLIRSEDIRCRFRQKLEWATEVDLATAWATNNVGLRDLRERRRKRGSFQGTGSLEVRSIVGLYSNITDPEALRTLSNIRELAHHRRKAAFSSKGLYFPKRDGCSCLDRKCKLHIRWLRRE